MWLGDLESQAECCTTLTCCRCHGIGVIPVGGWATAASHGQGRSPVHAAVHDARPEVYTPINAPVHAPVHASVHTPVHAPVHTPIHTPVHASIHASVHAPIHATTRVYAPVQPSPVVNPAPGLHPTRVHASPPVNLRAVAGRPRVN